MCPVCTVAIGVGLGLSRWLKIDDAISGLWIGAFILSLSFMMAKLTKKFVSIRLRFLTVLYFIFFLAGTFVPLEYYKITGNPLNQLWGIDKLILGVSIGFIVFPLSLLIHGLLKYQNHRKSYIPFQKVLIPVVGLSLASGAMCLLVR
ncbi:hypothetical protein MUP56_01210 [Patescibacteria group bacterium]|nr:hypothetical protein [Patescibacteria group bacterium]